LPCGHRRSGAGHAQPVGGDHQHLAVGDGDDISGSSFPATPGAVPMLQPYVGGAGTVYIWGRPDVGNSLVDLSLNLIAETQPICSPGCVTPNAISFTSATIYNQPFGSPSSSMVRFKYVDDSTSSPPLPIAANRIDGMEGLRIFEGGTVPAVGIGSFADPLRDSVNNSWLIATVTYNVLAIGENSETQLFLEIGPIGLNQANGSTSDANVVFGDATDAMNATLNGHDNRGVHPGNFDAKILPRLLPGDADRNGAVQQADYDIWRASFGSNTQLAADHNKNGIVDSADYVIWRDNLGLSAGSGGAIATPEPSAATTVSIALMALLAVCRLPFQRAK